jgi:xanthosine utilization system XapX-like protein
MDGRMLSGIALVGLSGLFCGYGILALIAAYRAGNATAWGKLALLGGISLLLGATLANIASRLIADASRHL